MNKGQNHQLYSGKKILGIDLGTKRVGLATYVPDHDLWPTPFCTLPFLCEADFMDRLKIIINDEAVEVLVVGLPRLLDGKETDMTRLIRKRAEKIAHTFAPLPLHLQDETLSSFEAEDRMKKSPRYNFKVDKQQVDALAAAIILEDFVSE